MTTGALFDPKALCGSTSCNPCGVGSGAASVANGADGRTGGCSAAAGAVAGAADAGPGSDRGATAGGGRVLCREGTKRATRMSTHRLTIAAMIRRRFTTTSRHFQSIKKMFAPEPDDSTAKCPQKGERRIHQWP